MNDDEPTEIIGDDATVVAGDAVTPPRGVPVTPAAPVTPAELGPVIEGFDRFSELGRGGFATVYRARQTALGRDVAVKVLHRSADDAAALASFRRESHLVADLSWHPHVAPVLEAGTTEPRDSSGRHPYLCFQLVEHGSLEDQIDRDGPLNWVAATRAAIEVADALAAAHAIGVIHRDIKVANVLVDRLGRGQLADFGIASLLGERNEGAGVAMTVAHAPPELFEGGSASPQSDIYSLGSMLFELLAGRAPFARLENESLPMMIERIVQQPLPPLPPDAAPASVGQVIAVAMAKHPEQRFASAIEFGRALQTAQSGASLELTPMPYCDRMAPQTAAARNRGSIAVRPPTAVVAASGGSRRAGVSGWLVAAGLALGVGGGVAGGLVLVDRLGSDTGVEVATADVADPVPDAVDPPSDTEAAPSPPPSTAQVVGIVGATASDTSPPLLLADGSELVISAADTIDGDRSTAWLVAGDGVGVTLQFDLGSKRSVTSVGLVPGYSGVDPVNGAERFPAVRRIASVRWTFDDGTSIEQTFADLDDLQRLEITPTPTRSIRLDILSTTEPGSLDFTAIAEVAVEASE
jgi:hypothetical protein